MCGFIGVIASSAVNQAAFQKGLAAIKARGTTIDTCIAGVEQHGYVRLPTDDVQNLSLGHIATGAKKLLFNGLITNVDDLVTMFRLSNQARQADTYCLQEGLSQHGGTFLTHARGMFAAAFMTDTYIMLVRDTVGIKPLYYAFEKELFAFASELKALLPLGVPVHEVPPGRIMTFDKKKHVLKEREYRYKSYLPGGSVRLESYLRASVVEPTKRYLLSSDKSVALLLSGGVDSSINAALLVSELTAQDRRRVVAFCIGNNDAPDVQTATRLAATLQLQLVHVRPYSPRMALQLLPDIVYKAESPYARVIKVALLYDALAAAIQKRGINVAIGGEGADELFFGYHRFINGLTHDQSAKLFGVFFEKIFHYTLLQRYDRIMAQRQIEGRVPYLDQELIELATAMRPDEKIQHFPSGHVSKIPLRVIAKKLGLPSYVYDRKKEKMTFGATGRENNTSCSGYLEQEAVALTHKTFQQLVSLCYQQQFGDALVADGRYTEERLMRLASKYMSMHRTYSKEAALL